MTHSRHHDMSPTRHSFTCPRPADAHRARRARLAYPRPVPEPSTLRTVPRCNDRVNSPALQDMQPRAQSARPRSGPARPAPIRTATPQDHRRIATAHFTNGSLRTLNVSYTPFTTARMTRDSRGRRRTSMPHNHSNRPAQTTDHASPRKPRPPRKLREAQPPATPRTPSQSAAPGSPEQPGTRNPHTRSTAATPPLE
jgi:hypothetical protein